MLSGNFFFRFSRCWLAGTGAPSRARHDSGVCQFPAVLAGFVSKIQQNHTTGIARHASTRLLCPWDYNSSNRQIYKFSRCKFTSVNRLCQIQSGKFPSLDNNKEKFSAFIRTDPLYWLTLSSSELLVSQLELGNREQRWESSEQKKKIKLINMFWGVVKDGGVLSGHHLKMSREDSISSMEVSSLSSESNDSFTQQHQRRSSHYS